MSTDSPDESDHSGTPNLEQLDALKQVIWTRRPILGEIMRKHGDTYLYRYAQDFMDVNACPLLDERKDELIDTARDLLADRLGPAVAENVAAQLRALPLVSTTDHHGPIDHPFFVNANIISAIPFLEYGDPLRRYLVVFSFASVSINNASAYPRGILFHGTTDRAESLIRLPILPDKMKMGVVYGMRPFTRADLDRAEGDLEKKTRAGEVTPERSAAVRDTLETYFGTPAVLGAPDLASQITKINYELWPKLFHAGRTQADGQPSSSLTVPDLVYLEIETLVTELMLRRHLRDTASPFHKLLFDSSYQQLALKYFNNLAGGFSIEKDWGTYMFWAVDEKLRRVRLKLDGQTLVSPDGSMTIDLVPDEIERLLRERKIFPSMLLAYLMVSMYYGMKCLGGFSQVHDLTMVKAAWTRFLEDIGDERQAAALDPLQTRELGGDGMVLAYFKTQDGNVVPATGIDMLLDANATSFEQYVARSKSVTLADMMNPMLPEMYVVLYPIQDRQPELAAVTPEHVMEMTGLKARFAQDAELTTPVVDEPVETPAVNLDVDQLVPVEKQTA
ncbi:MAG: hypothetical protein HY976_00375 [Candidatus Kerfeldbacteria bacterium]|nr:hypothetical protein [Candidatus Kerfeldbacteria bacterium]